MADTPVLSTSNVTRRFGRKAAVAGVSLSIGPGEIHALVGPNGSGKSTLARLVVGLLRPHSGSVAVGGHDPRLSAAARRLIGYLGHQSLLYRDLTPLENLHFVASLYQLSDPNAAATAALDDAGVGPERGTPLKRLSRGMVQRVALARSLVHRPALLVWDEPLTGLDQVSVARTVALMATVRASGTAVVLISHDLAELWRVSAQVHVLHRGTVRASADTSMPLDQFRARYAEVTSV